MNEYTIYLSHELGLLLQPLIDLCLVLFLQSRADHFQTPGVVVIQPCQLVHQMTEKEEMTVNLSSYLSSIMCGWIKG